MELHKPLAWGTGVKLEERVASTRGDGVQEIVEVVDLWDGRQSRA